MSPKKISVCSDEIVQDHLGDSFKRWTLAVDHTYNTNCELYPLLMFGFLNYEGQYLPIGMVISSHEDADAQSFMLRYDYSLFSNNSAPFYQYTVVSSVNPINSAPFYQYTVAPNLASWQIDNSSHFYRFVKDKARFPPYACMADAALSTSHALQLVFPNTIRLVCFWHVGRNVR